MVCGMEDGEKTYNDCLEDILRAHADGSMCVCLEDQETFDHIIWKCSRFSSQRASLIQRLLLSGVYKETPIRDLCAQLNWKALRECSMFFVECGVKM
jgi:hypothetical protein